LWIAMVGCVSDWFVPEFCKEFSKKYPDILPPDTKIKSPGDILFKTRMGLLCKIINFNLKYPTKEAMTAVKIISRIDDPREILDQTTPAGKYIYKHYEHYNKIYEEIISKVNVTKDRLLLLAYEDKYSLSSELSNDLMYAHPEKFVLIARLKSDSYVCSIRSITLDVRSILERALAGIEGYGGGHEHACGGNVKLKDWERFLENIRRELNKLNK
jgi:nanoRNase/pAp phosphatase (c-di-AMP/oligoRNAs hydrolase)